jgi:cytochrome c-type biogenesis protein CcmH/NrfG
VTIVNIQAARNSRAGGTRIDGYSGALNDVKSQYRSEKSAEVPRFSEQMADLTREEVQLRIENSEAKNDTKIVRLESKLDLVLSKLDAAKSDSLAIRTNQWVIAFGLALLIVAVVALFPVFFGIGTQMKDMIDSAVQVH